MSTGNERRIMRVRWFDRRKGYGFLVPVNQALESDGQNSTVFVYHNQLKTMYLDNIFRMLYAGEYVECDISKDENDRTVAKHVSGVQDGPLMCEVRAMNSQNRPEDDMDERPPSHRDTTRGRDQGGGRGRGRGRGRSHGGRRPVSDMSGMDA